jgi:hypothetical protein
MRRSLYVELGASPGGGAFPSDAKTLRRQFSGVGGLRNSPSCFDGLRSVLGLLPPPSIRLGASRWGSLAPPPGDAPLTARCVRRASLNVSDHPPAQLSRASVWMRRLSPLRRGHKAIARHDRKELRAVWRPASTNDFGDVAEVLRADIRSQDDERTRALTVRIAESVH